MLLRVVQSSRRCYSTSRIRIEELLPEIPGRKNAGQSKPAELDSLYTGRIAKWVEWSRITESWDTTKEHRGDMLRAMMLALNTRNRYGSEYRALRKHYERIKQFQAFDPDLVEKFGVELAAANKLISLGCRVAFANSPNTWFGVSENGRMPALPNSAIRGIEIEAVDARDSLLMTDSAEWLGRLNGLQFLRLRRCPFVDDHLLSRLAFKCNKLKILEVSNCPGITWEGVASLWRLRNLRRLVLSENFHLLSHQPDGLACVPAQLEALVPGLFVEGIEDLAAPAFERVAANETASADPELAA